MYMTCPKLEQGEQPDTDLRELQFKKSNYGRVSNNIVLRYQGGLFLPESGLSTLDKLAREQKAEESFLHCSLAMSGTGATSVTSLTRPLMPPPCSARNETPMGCVRRI
jgi:RecA-family ATPase